MKFGLWIVTIVAVAGCGTSPIQEAEIVTDLGIGLSVPEDTRTEQIIAQRLATMRLLDMGHDLSTFGAEPVSLIEFINAHKPRSAP